LNFVCGVFGTPPEGEIVRTRISTTAGSRWNSMPDCFISYCSNDAEFATAVYQDLTAHGLDVFMAGISLQPGDRWSAEIHRALANSKWVIFLASKAACDSKYVEQEIGGALLTKKDLIPVVWDMNPAELPGWTNQIHALDVRRQSPEQIQMHIQALARRLKSSKDKGFLIGAGLVVGFFWLMSRGE
jgi:hypothetical protein